LEQGVTAAAEGISINEMFYNSLCYKEVADKTKKLIDDHKTENGYDFFINSEIREIPVGVFYS
jgi:hypothetical protein